MTFKERYQYNPATDLLGKGGFARVYKAHDTNLDIDVAVKFFNATEAGSGKYTVYEEIKRGIKLNHPNILRYFDAAILENTNSVGEQEVIQVGIMELANGGDLKQFVRMNPGSPELLWLLKEVLGGLDYLHRQGLIHRDLKPQNILLTHQEGNYTAKLSDFGISKALDSSGISSSKAIGTIEYMAPEQFNPQKYGINGEIGTNLDLWSFGVMVYELVAGVPLFGQRGGNTSAEQIMISILSPELPDSIHQLPEPYRSVVRRCLVHNAADRVQRASDLTGMLDVVDLVSSSRYREEIPAVSDVPETMVMQKVVETPVRAESGASGIPAPSRRKKSFFLPLSILVICFVVGFLYIFLSRHDTEDVYATALRQYEANQSDSSMATLKTIFSDLTEEDTPYYKMSHALMARNILKLGDTVSAIPYLETAARLDDDTSLLELGRIYYHGRHVTQDLKRAFRYFSKSAASGNGTAMHNVGYAYLAGEGVEKDLDQALSWYRKAAEKGVSYSMHDLGLMYRDGLGVKRNYATALEWFMKGAEKKHTTSMVAIGDFYWDGRGVKKDPVTMMGWYQKAADLGDEVAMLRVGYAYFEGSDIKKNDREALKWFQKAAELGNVSAMSYMGYIHFSASSTIQDYPKAMEWFQKAADKGDPYAVFCIGIMYENGYSVEVNREKAKEFYRKACEADYKDGCTAIQNMGE